MAAFNRMKGAQYLWRSLVILTIIGCIGVCKSNSSETSKLSSSDPEQLTDEACIPVCNTKECLLHSKFLLSNIEPKADACENYSGFACGKFQDKFTFNESGTVLADQVLALQPILKEILDGIEPDFKTATGKLKVVYESCLKESSSDVQSIATLLEFLSSVGIPNWPNLDHDFQFNEIKLKSVLGKLLTNQEFGLIHVKRSLSDETDTNLRFKTEISIAKSSYKEKNKSFRKYLIERILKYFEFESTTIDGIWEESENINEAIALLQKKSKENEPEDSITIFCVNNTEKHWEFPCEVLESFIDNAGLNATISKEFVTINADSIYFVENIFNLLKNFSDRSIANYLAFHVFFDHLESLNSYFQLALLKDPIVPRGIGIPWKRCIFWIIKNMFFPMAHEYIKEFTMEEINKVASLVEVNLQEVADVISSQDWMKEDVRMISAEEVRNISQSWLQDVMIVNNETALNELYNEFLPSNASFLYNELEHSRFSNYEDFLNRHHLAYLLPVGDRDKSLLKIGARGGNYNIYINIGLLLPPLYRPGLKMPLNLISLATMIAHEIGHSFVYSVSWFFWDSDPAAFEYGKNAFTCLVDQYSKFKYKTIEKSVNGSKYAWENIADAVAISIIDRFIEKYSSSDEAFLLPGLPYTMEQILYLSALEVWCESNSRTDELFNYEEDNHSLGEFRMLGMLQNSKSFAKAFSCSEGSYMNPATKCKFLNR